MIHCVSAQYKNLLHKEYKDIVEAVDQLNDHVIIEGRKDSLFVSQYTQEMRAWAEANNDNALVLEADLLKAYAYLNLYGRKQPSLVKDLIPIAERAKEEQISQIEARASKAIATHYWYTKEYAKSFEWSLRLSTLLDNMAPESFPNMAWHLSFIGKCYYHFGDYEKASTYFEKASNITKTGYNAVSVIESQNTLGLCYQKLGDLDRSDRLLRSVVNDTSQFRNPVWVGIASGNLGYNQYLRGNYEEAIPLFETDIENAIQINDYGLAAGSTIPLADVYLKQSKIEASRQKIEEARAYISRSGQHDRLRNLYPVMSKWHAANGYTDSSTVYLDSALLATKAYNDKYNALQLVRANQNAQFRERKLEVERLETESKLKLSQRNFLITIISGLLLITILAFIIRNKYLLKKKQVQTLELTNTKKELHRLTSKIREDNKIIVELQQNSNTKKNKEFIDDLKTKSILTNADWVAYQELFYKAYPKFLSSLSKTYPDLSEAEIRCLCLEKLELSNNEMALVLGVSPNSMRVTKHRIRKKLDLQSQEDLKDIIEQIG